ncbi:hypothetical protein ABEW05_006764 [Botrytis cinerea]
MKERGILDATATETATATATATATTKYNIEDPRVKIARSDQHPSSHVEVGPRILRSVLL